jgi:glycosyltransferase involved in cell wall biosynthesis
MSGFLVPEPPPGSSPGDRPSFSVLVPAYNASDTIQEALASALGQTEPAAEIIVCDDGSTDATAELASALDPRITVARKPNGGGASALNRALAGATGDFVCVLDADDTYAPTRLRRLGDLAAARPDLDMLGTDAWFERRGAVDGTFFGANPFPTTDQRAAALRASPLVHGVMRRSRLLRIGGWREHLRVVYDWDCYLRMLFDGARCGAVDEPLMRYRLHESSLSGDRSSSLTERALWLAGCYRELALTERERAALRISVRKAGRRAVREGIRALRVGQPNARAQLDALAREQGLSIGVRLAAFAGRTPGVV